MEEKPSGNQAPASSKGSSFFIENILGKRGSAEEPEARGGRWIPGAEGAAGGDLEPPSVQWYRGGTELNFTSLETSESE